MAEAAKYRFDILDPTFLVADGAGYGGPRTTPGHNICVKLYKNKNGGKKECDFSVTYFLLLLVSDDFVFVVGLVFCYMCVVC